MTSNEFKIFTEKYSEAIERLTGRLKAAPNDTYRDELIVTLGEATCIMLSEINDAKMEEKRLADNQERTFDSSDKPTPVHEKPPSDLPEIKVDPNKMEHLTEGAQLGPDKNEKSNNKDSNDT